MHRGFIKNGRIVLSRPSAWDRVRFPCTVVLDWDAEALGEYGATRGEEGDRALDRYIAERVQDGPQIAAVSAGRTAELKPVILVQFRG